MWEEIPDYNIIYVEKVIIYKQLLITYKHAFHTTAGKEGHMNILLLMADELRADVTGFMGNPVIRTPNLDRLAEKATVFENAYTPAPICIPARQCITAGQYPSNCGCQRWYEDLPPGYLTFPRLLSQNGYETAACGKLHHVGPDQMQGYTRRFGMECEVVGKYIPDLNKPYDGFSRKWSQKEEVERATDKCKTFHIRQDEEAVRCAEYFIEQYFLDPFYQRCSSERPLLLTVSFNQPHYPYVADPELMEYYYGLVEPYVGEEVFSHPFLSRFAVDTQEEKVRRATAAYYSMVEKMDSYIGRVLAALERAGQDPGDWMYVFTSDHGEMLGEHGVWEKQKFFEGSARVPLMIHLPGGRQAASCSRNVSLCDLYATIVENAGLKLPDGLDSRDLTGLLYGRGEWDNECISMFDGTNIMVKRDCLKYQYYGNDMPEVLFDLEVEPDERRNLLDMPEYAEFIGYARRRIREFGFGLE